MQDAAEDLAKLLQELGYAIRARLLKVRDTSGDAHAVAHEGGDTIFGIDRHVEPLIEQCIKRWPAHLLPVTVICEGLGSDGTIKIGGAGEAQFRLLIDPIDGTRALMYDKRSAWMLAAAAPERGAATRLSQAIAAVAVELPTSKQSRADAFVATSRSLNATRTRIDGAEPTSLEVTPSSAATLRHGFGHVVNFFPGTKRLAADLMETIAKATLGDVSIAEASIFDDQYISTGGQMIELATGRDRFCCDLRPLFYRILARDDPTQTAGLECHPYDVAATLVAQKAGVVITDGFGDVLDAPFDVTTGVHWCGYANENIRGLVEPVLQGWLSKQGLAPS